MTSNSNSRTPKIGEIYLMNFSGHGSEQSGWRPGVVFQNNTCNKHSPNIIALPLTSSLKKLDQPTHVLLKAEDTELLKDSIVLCENPQRMSKESLGNYITTLSDSYIEKIAIANLLATSAISFIDPSVLMFVHQQARMLNNFSDC